MRLLRAIIKDFQEKQNLDIYITVLLAIVVSILGIVQVANQAVVLSAVLATLALVSFSLLANRKEYEDLRALLSKVDSTKNLASKFFQKDFSTFSLKERVRTAQKIYFWSFSYRATVPLLKNSIEEALRNGLVARFLFIDPNSNAIDMGAFFSRSRDTASLKNTIESNIKMLSKLGNKVKAGRLEIRSLNCIPPYMFIAIDPHLPTGSIFIQPTSFRVPREYAPAFELQRADDQEWFSYFLSQFESIWDESTQFDTQDESLNENIN